MTLAKWIASADNPLTARVMVNRIWQHHFGEGIVRTSERLRQERRAAYASGAAGLAGGALRAKSGWDIKAMHKLMLLSNTYRQASENPLYKDIQGSGEQVCFWPLQPPASRSRGDSRWHSLHSAAG